MKFIHIVCIVMAALLIGCLIIIFKAEDPKAIQAENKELKLKNSELEKRDKELSLLISKKEKSFDSISLLRKKDLKELILLQEQNLTIKSKLNEKIVIIDRYSNPELERAFADRYKQSQD